MQEDDTYQSFLNENFFILRGADGIYKRGCRVKVQISWNSRCMAYPNCDQNHHFFSTISASHLTILNERKFSLWEARVAAGFTIIFSNNWTLYRKTTLLKCIAQLTRFDDGIVSFNGRCGAIYSHIRTPEDIGIPTYRSQVWVFTYDW